MAAPKIDRDKLRTATRRLSDDQIRYMLDDAIDLLPPARLAELAKGYLNLAQLRPDTKGKGGPDFDEPERKQRATSLQPVGFPKLPRSARQSCHPTFPG